MKNINFKVTVKVPKNFRISKALIKQLKDNLELGIWAVPHEQDDYLFDTKAKRIKK